MDDPLYVKPAQGARIRQPDRGGRVMPEEGAFVPRDAYYTRLLLTKDVVEAEPPKKPAAPQPATDAAQAKPDTSPAPAADKAPASKKD